MSFRTPCSNQFSLAHVRALYDFLRMKAPKHSDDVVAVQFLASWEPRSCLTPDGRDYVNMRVMHWTTTRGEGPAPWQMDKSREVFPDFRAFLLALVASDPAKAEWFGQWVQLEGADEVPPGATPGIGLTVPIRPRTPH